MSRFHKNKDALLSAVYLVIILYITLFTRDPLIIRRTRITPFWSYLECFRGNIKYSAEILLNIGLFVPLGFFLANTICRRGEHTRHMLTLLFGIIISAFIEALQYLTGRGMLDCDDLINNTFGLVAGICISVLCSHCATDRFCFPWRLFLSVLFMSAGLVGCFLAPTSGKDDTIIEFVSFEVESAICRDNEMTIQGICALKNYKTPGYKIVLKEESTGHTFPLETQTTGDHFLASAKVDLRKNYEIDIQFQGYRPVNSLVYIHDGQVAYTSSIHPEPGIQDTDLSEIVHAGYLKAYEPAYEVFVYQFQDKFYWLIGTDIDENTEIICHLYTEEPEKLPEKRIQYGTDNIGFHAGGKNEITNSMRCGRYRVFVREIPADYTVTLVRVGFRTDDKISWTAYFRLKPFHTG